MDIVDLLLYLMGIGLVCSLLRWVYDTTRKPIVRLGRRIDPRPQAHIRRRFQRIVKHTDKRNKAIAQVYTEEARAINDIFRRTNHE